MKVAVFEANDIPFRKCLYPPRVQKQLAASAQGYPDLLRGSVAVWRISCAWLHRHACEGQALGLGVLGEDELMGCHARIRESPDVSSMYEFHPRLQSPTAQQTRRQLSAAHPRCAVTKRTTLFCDAQRRSERPARLFAQVRSTAGLGVMVSVCIFVGLDEAEHQAAWLCAGDIPANAGNSHLRFDNTPSIALYESNHLI